MKIVLLIIAGAVFAVGSTDAQAAQVVVVSRLCSGLANATCIANCGAGQTVLSITAGVTKNGVTVWDAMAPTSVAGVKFKNPTVAYDNYRIRLVCLAP